MSPRDRDRKDKPERDLERVAREYAALQPDQPPAMLDQAVLNAARRAVEGEAHPTRPWNFGWMHATATAALLVLGVALVLQQRPEPPQPVPEAKEFLRSKDDSSAVSAQRANETGLPDAAVPAEEIPERVALDRVQQAPVNAPEDRQEAARPAASGIVGTQALRDQRADRPADEPVAAAAAWEMEQAEQDAASGTPEEGFAARKAAAPPAALETQKREVALGPEVWLAAILEMKEAGDEEGWRRELEAFLAVYPDHPLPDELRAALADSAPAPKGE